jgi:CheY-like chemotaxis protein
MNTKPSILIIEDYKSLLKYLTRFLEQEGFNIYAANNGFVGISYYETYLPDLVITDIIMPDMDGLEVIMKLKKKYPNCKIIAMSAGGKIASSDYLTQAALLGAISTLNKPIENELLLSEIYKHLS